MGVSKRAGFGALAVSVLLAAPAAAQPTDRPVVLDTAPLQSGEQFECRIPVEIRSPGRRELQQLRVVATVYDGSDALASTGLSTDRGYLVADLDEAGIDYDLVPLQFDLTADLCARIDGLRVDRAWCRFERGGVEPCEDLVRFARASRSDPLFLQVP